MSLVQRYQRKKGKLPRLAKQLNWQRSLHQLSPCASARYGKGFGGDEDPRITRDFQEASSVSFVSLPLDSGFQISLVMLGLCTFASSWDTLPLRLMTLMASNSAPSIILQAEME